jgi:hypothetical protein
MEVRNKRSYQMILTVLICAAVMFSLAAGDLHLLAVALNELKAPSGTHR